MLCNFLRWRPPSPIRSNRSALAFPYVTQTEHVEKSGYTQFRFSCETVLPGWSNRVLYDRKRKTHKTQRKTGTAVRIECREIKFYYPGSTHPVLDNLSLVLEEPGLHGLFGPSGVGKTSLAKILSGLLQPASGQIRTEGMNTVLYCHNLERLPGWSGVGRHLERVTPPHHAGLKETLIQRFGLDACLQRRFGGLSLGQQNRINLVRYLVQDMQLLIMDESLANVDEHTRSTILVTIKEAFPQTCFLYISHNLVEVARFCRRIWVLRDPRKRPQAVSIQGLDACHPGAAGIQALEKTMLEMMNAA